MTTKRPTNGNHRSTTATKKPAHPDLPQGLAPGSALLRPGKMIILETASVGGVRYEGQNRETLGSTQVISMAKRMDDPKLEKMVSKIKNTAYAIVRKHAVHLDLGCWFADTQALSTIDEELNAECRPSAHIANEIARSIASPRQTRCEIWPLNFDHKDPKLSLRLGQMIHARLLAVRDSYLSKEPDTYRVAKDRCKNLDQLVQGYQSDAIRLALLSAEEQRPIMIANYGGVQYPAEWQGAIPDFDFGPIDKALGLFEEAAFAFL